MLAVAVVASAWGAGFYTADVDVRGYGRGGAWVAGVDSLSAQYYNPAALYRLDGPTATVQVSAVAQPLTFQRAPSADGTTYEEVRNEAPPFVIPNIAVGHDFGLDQLGVAVGLYTPFAPSFAYPDDGAQRFSLVESGVGQTYVGPSAAWRFADWVSVGGGAAWSVVWTEYALAITTYVGGSDDPTDDVTVSMDLTDRRGFSWFAGFVVEPPSGAWAVAGSLKPAASFDARGPLEADFSRNTLYVDLGAIEDPVVRDEEVVLRLRMPLLARVGGLVRPTERIEVEADLVVEDWRSVDTLGISEVELVLQTSLGEQVIDDDLSIPAGYDLAWSARLGGHFDVHPRVRLRAGALFETGAVPRESVNVALPDGHKVAWTAGTTGWLWEGRLGLDVGWLHGIVLPIVLDDSDQTQIAVNALTGEVGEGLTVGNGEIRTHIFIGGLGVTLRAAPSP